MFFFLRKGVVLALLLLPYGLAAQSNIPINFQLEAQAIATSSDDVPFWFRAKQGGSVPLSGLSGSLIGYVSKDYDTTQRRVVDWGFALEGRANGGQSGTDLILVQANAKVKLAMLEIKAGRWRQQVGLLDTLLSSGAFSLSGNALGVPQIQLSIPDFYALPFTNGWFSIKGALSHGWLGTLPLQSEMTHLPEVKTYFHHKSFYGKLGKPSHRINLYGGFNHQAFWGNERQIFGPTHVLTTWQAYQSVLYGRNWAGSKVGNHLGSIDVGIKANLASVDIFAYRQFFYEVGALAHMGNITDGLNGLSITNKREAGKGGFRWEKILLEFLYSKNQAGKLSSPATPSGHENYYNHYLYKEGWSYRGRTLGNPFFTAKAEAKPDQAQIDDLHFINNRIIALHGGLAASWNNWKFKGLLSYSRNFGLYATSGQPYRIPFKQIKYPEGEPVFQPVSQVSGFLSAERHAPLRNTQLSYYWGGQLALDNDGILNNSAGLLLKYGITF